MRKKNLINLHSVGFFTIFVLCNLVHSHKFHIHLKGHSQLLDRADLHTTVAALRTIYIFRKSMEKLVTYLENQAFSTVNLRQWFRLHAISLLYWCLNLDVFVDVWLFLKKFMGKFSILMVYKQWVLWYGVGPIKTISACNYFNSSRFVWSIPDTLLFHTHLVTCKSAKEWYLMRMYISCLCPFKNHLIIFLKNLTIPIYNSPKIQGH